MTSNLLAGKTCLVTGATAGIGRVTAGALAAMGAKLVITGRNLPKTEETVGRIKEETGNTDVHFLIADFTDLGAVRRLAAEYRERFPRLHVLLNNAGGFYNSRRRTPYGVETTFLVNHLAPFLLTNLLLETIVASAPARIVNVSSDAHRFGSMDFDDLGFARGYFGIKAYARSKLANVMFTYELSRRLDGKGVAVNAVHPGHVATDIWKTEFGLIGPLLKWIMGLFALTPEEGADNSIYLASSPDVERMTGRYFVGREAAESSVASHDPETARKLWEVSERLTSVV